MFSGCGCHGCGECSFHGCRLVFEFWIAVSDRICGTVTRRGARPLNRPRCEGCVVSRLFQRAATLGKVFFQLFEEGIHKRLLVGFLQLMKPVLWLVIWRFIQMICTTIGGRWWRHISREFLSGILILPYVQLVRIFERRSPVDTLNGAYTKEILSELQGRGSVPEPNWILGDECRNESRSFEGSVGLVVCSRSVPFATHLQRITVILKSWSLYMIKLPTLLSGMTTWSLSHEKCKLCKYLNSEFTYDTLQKVMLFVHNRKKPSFTNNVAFIPFP